MEIDKVAFGIFLLMISTATWKSLRKNRSGFSHQFPQRRLRDSLPSGKTGNQTQHSFYFPCGPNSIGLTVVEVRGAKAATCAFALGMRSRKTDTRKRRRRVRANLPARGGAISQDIIVPSEWFACFVQREYPECSWPNALVCGAFSRRTFPTNLRNSNDFASRSLGAK